MNYLLWFLVMIWLVSIALTIYGLLQQRSLKPSSDLRLTSLDAPLVSVLLPARNEEYRVLKECVRSILAQDYGRFELIAVDDRSTDRTKEILNSLAKTDGRLRVVEGEQLPAGWLGKPFAMHQALRYARGEWILATDADMIYHKSALRTAIEKITEQKADAMTLIPHFEARSFWERVITPAWEWVMLMFVVSYRINNPKSQGAFGIGAFILVRRSRLDHVGAYEALKDEVLEDMRLAEKIKRSGGRMITEHAPRLLSTRMYSSFGEMWESCTKSWFAGMRFSFWFALVCVAWAYLIAVLPPVMAISALIGITPEVVWPAVLCWIGQVIVLMLLSFRARISPVYSLTAPLGLGLLYAMLLDSSIRIKMGKGVIWKGRRIYESAGVAPPKLSVR